MKIGKVYAVFLQHRVVLHIYAGGERYAEKVQNSNRSYPGNYTDVRFSFYIY